MTLVRKIRPAVKMLTIIIYSCHGPANADNSAVPNASPPANKVPNPLLNPLLRVAPVQFHFDEL